MSDVKYLIFDVEAVGDGELIQRVKYPDEVLSEREAIERFQSDLLEQTGRDVLPPTFVVPVSVAVAKVTRDRLMLEYHEQFPLYGFDEHKGYPTPQHLARLKEHGPCPIHRTTFKPVRELLEPGLF